MIQISRGCNDSDLSWMHENGRSMAVTNPGLKDEACLRGNNLLFLIFNYILFEVNGSEH